MNKNLTIILIIIVVVLLLFLLNKPVQTTLYKNEQVRITTSLYPLYFFTQEIGKEKIAIKNITPAGVEPHDYEPTARDLAFLEESNLVILNGAGLEIWGTKIKKNLTNKKTKIITVAEDLATLEIEKEGKKIKDPHVWLNPNLAKQQVQLIYNALSEIDEKNKNYYQKNSSELKEKLTKLEQSYRRGLADCQRRDFVTSHTAFSYLASFYNLNQIPISGLSTEEEPTTKQLTEIARIAKEKNIEYIFFESLVSPKLAQTIAEEIGAKTLVLNPLEGITPDQEKRGENYFTIMEQNLANLRLALKCQ